MYGVNVNMSSFFKAWAKDNVILAESSSGGVFSILSEYVINNGGIVFGASQDEKFNLKHIGVSNVDDLHLVRKSKYYQSDFMEVFTEASKALRNGRLVLVSGTACQIQSIYNYLSLENIKTNNLITVDVLCHGVSNIAILKRYIESQEKRFNKKIINLTFRTKEVSWEKGGGTSMTIYFDDSTSLIVPWKKDAYYLAFNNDLSLRPSCHKCRFVGMDRVSDFTLADFWGINSHYASPEQLKNGVGLMVANTQKAYDLLNTEYFSKNCCYEEINSNLATPYNAAFHTRRHIHSKRSFFFKNVQSRDFNGLVNQCLYKERFIYFAKDMYHKLIK